MRYDKLLMDDAMFAITAPYEFYARRIETVSRLFAEDSTSIDAVVLAGTALTALATWRYDRSDSRGDQQNFERLLLEYWAQYDDRVSIPEMVRWLDSRPANERSQELIDAILGAFPVRFDMSIRSTRDDPARVEWERWMRCSGNGFREGDRFSYARILFRHFRNSVQHRLFIADGHETFALGTYDSPFFYANHGLAGQMTVHGIRFGFQHRYFEPLLRDVVVAVRHWAVENRRDIFDMAPLL
jgi:hypothetical protein